MSIPSNENNFLVLGIMILMITRLGFRLLVPSLDEVSHLLFEIPQETFCSFRFLEPPSELLGDPASVLLFDRDTFDGIPFWLVVGGCGGNFRVPKGR